MKTSTIIIVVVVVLLVLGVAGGLYVRQQIRGMVEGAKVIVVMSQLAQASADLKKQGSFTNALPNLCDIYRFTNSFTINGKQYQCALAAKSPSFNDRGVMAITTNDVMLWVDHDNKATLVEDAGSDTQ